MPQIHICNLIVEGGIAEIKLSRTSVQVRGKKATRSKEFFLTRAHSVSDKASTDIQFSI